MGVAESVFAGIVRAMEIVGRLVLAFMAVTITHDAVARYLFAAPTSWSLEVNTFLIVYLAAMTAAEAQRRDDHIRITFFQDRMPPGMRRAGRVLIGVAGMGFCGIMAWRGFLLAHGAWIYEERVSSSFGTPLVFPYGMLPIGFGALTIQFLIETIRAVAGTLDDRGSGDGGAASEL
ncbi:MAG TPA: TRAP transporter small permease [Paracoccaceae bacterium]|nr:TRAP transporter small permease [Paracoccaceae bacterium]